MGGQLYGAEGLNGAGPSGRSRAARSGGRFGGAVAAVIMKLRREIRREDSGKADVFGTGNDWGFGRRPRTARHSDMTSR